MLISLVLFAVINVFFAGAGYFGLQLDYREFLPVLNAFFCAILAVVYFLQQHKKLGLQSGGESGIGSVPLEAPLPFAYEEDGSLLQYMPSFLCLKDADGRWLLASEEYLESLNLQDIDYKGKTNAELARYPQSDAHALELANIQDKSAWHLGQKLKETKAINIPNKKSKTFQITRIPIFDAGFNKSKLLLVGKYISHNESPQQDEKVAADGQVIYETRCDDHFSLLYLDVNFKITQVNSLFCKLTGYSAQEVIGKHICIFIVGDFNPAHSELFAENNGLWSGELICRHKKGFYFPIQLNITQVTVGHQVRSYFASLFDITRQKRAENRIMQIAHYDDLTGLVNRVMFFERLNQFLAKAGQYYAVVFFIDLDRFKAVNDSLGHDAGDQLLKEVAERLLEVTRKKDVVSRLSGDEFAVLMLNEITHAQAVYSASMIAEKIIQKLSEAFYIQRNEVFIGASIGIAIYPEDGKTAEQLLKRADISMYEAKKQGRNNYQFYKADYIAASQDRLAMEMNLRKAIEKNQLQLYYQPQYKAIDGVLCGAEVLIRWLHGPIGQAKMISPDKFITIAEETGLIVDIGQWILQTACFQMKKWLDQGLSLPRISVNVSARQFSDNNFLKGIEDALTASGLDPKYLELELTESMLIGDIKQIELQLQRIKKMGIAMVLDDFGTGYSSLSYLKNFPIDVLKIDKSFVQGTALYSKNGRIACAIINMGHSLGQKIVAEGVETKEQLMFLRNRGCDIIQGYYFSEPLPVQKMTAVLRAETDGIGLGKKKNQDHPDNLFQS